MIERRTLYSGYDESAVPDPRKGDLFVSNENKILIYDGYAWMPYPDPFAYDPAMQFLQNNYHTLEAHLFGIQHRMMSMTHDEHDALADFAKYLMDRDKRSEILEDYDLWRAQERLEG